ncbi:MAG: 50S ribosomal protein L24 [Methanomassiliicoccales archaeon]|nr:MAG: 50S ribosomal protein L24 [Methanomassiliicoccales archaeon]
MTKSAKARKQRKAQHNAPVHVKSRMVASHLSDELKKEYKRRSARVVRGDTVKVMRGDADIIGLEGKVTDLDLSSGRVYIEGVTIAKADGTMEARSVHASNLVITKLETKDPWRKSRLQKKEVSA